MSRELRFRLGDLLADGPRCDFLGDEELIDFVENRLGATRHDAFHRHVVGCASCSELVDDLAIFRKLTAAGVIVPAELAAFRAADSGVRRRLSRIVLGSRLRTLFYWLSPVLVSLLAVLLLWPSPSRMTGEIETMPFLPPPAVRSADLGQVWRQVGEAWSAGEMRHAAALLEAAVAESPQEADLQFYLGYARLRNGEPGRALDALQQADRLQADAPSEHTRWMLAAALERVDRKDEACAALRSVVEIGATRASAAREIVERDCR